MWNSITYFIYNFNLHFKLLNSSYMKIRKEPAAGCTPAHGCRSRFSVKSVCQELWEIFAMESYFFRVFRTLRFAVLKTFGNWESSLLASYFDQHSCCMNRMCFILGSWASLKTYFLGTKFCYLMFNMDCRHQWWHS